MLGAEQMTIGNTKLGRKVKVGWAVRGTYWWLVDFHQKRPVTRGYDIFCNVCFIKALDKQSNSGLYKMR